MQKWMEDRCNLDIDIIALPGWSDATSKISLLMGDINKVFILAFLFSLVFLKCTILHY